MGGNGTANKKAGGDGSINIVGDVHGDVHLVPVASPLRPDAEPSDSEPVDPERQRHLDRLDELADSPQDSARLRLALAPSPMVDDEE